MVSVITEALPECSRKPEKKSRESSGTFELNLEGEQITKVL